MELVRELTKVNLQKDERRIDGIINFIIKTDNQDGFWLWQVDHHDILKYFGLPADYIGIITEDEFARFINDNENEHLGTSSGMFDTIKEARKEMLDTYKRG
jgi:hypothetical protein